MYRQNRLLKVLPKEKHRWCKGLISLLLVTILLFVCVGCDNGSSYYETNDPAEYGNYIGGAQKFMTAYINPFFPAEISEEFEDVRYTYHVSETDEYSFEAYLEFTIKDQTQFQEHIKAATEGMLTRPFHFDASWQEYILQDQDTGFYYDHLILNKPVTYGTPPETHYRIDYAKIAKILVNEEEQRVIYVALALHDGGGTHTGKLNTFFNRFDIEPKEYEEFVNS